MHESVVDPQPAPNSADLAAENRRRTALKLLGIAAVIAAAAVFFALRRPLRPLHRRHS
ncbi:hypothetical protein [Sutterella wadsworthensis]|uniref:hypothetical protein n=1 Tax=Sutterella wadsworthensis TaxID=40545 RepID=UPI00242B857E|nr:hypothetical protein [Sutterella wadsworthensis]